jgi:hypothetical protein
MGKKLSLNTSFCRREGKDPQSWMGPDHWLQSEEGKAFAGTPHQFHSVSMPMSLSLPCLVWLLISVVIEFCF